MNTLDFVKMKEILQHVSETLIQNEKYLCSLDTVVGDGDHGVTVSRGFKKVSEILTGDEYANIGELLEKTGKTLISGMGGATGPIFGTVFTAAGKTCGDKREIDISDIYEMFDSSLQAVKKIGNASEGDRTMVDALSPTVDALKTARERNLSLAESFNLAEEYARAGMESTKNMIAKKGRAKFLGEKSIGYQDAGATTFYLIIKSFSEYFKEKSL